MVGFICCNIKITIYNLFAIGNSIRECGLFSLILHFSCCIKYAGKHSSIRFLWKKLPLFSTINMDGKPDDRAKKITWILAKGLSLYIYMNGKLRLAAVFVCFFTAHYYLDIENWYLWLFHLFKKNNNNELWPVEKSIDRCMVQFTLSWINSYETSGPRFLFTLHQ